MKKTIFLLFFLLFLLPQKKGYSKKLTPSNVEDIAKLVTLDTASVQYVPGQYLFRRINHQAFAEGEYLKYSVRVYGIKIGTMEFNISPETAYVAFRNTYEVTAVFSMSGLVGAFARVQDTFKTWIDKEAIIPLKYYEGHHENNYHKTFLYSFYPEDSVAFLNGKMYEVPPNVQDLISEFYFCRTLNFSSLEGEKIYRFDTFYDENVLSTGFAYLEKKVIRTKVGKIRTLKLSPILYSGVEIDTSYRDAYVFVSDDENKIPIRVEIKLPPIGRVSLELIEYKNLVQEMNFKRKK